MTLATVNWSGAGDWHWRDELWAFLFGMRDELLNSIPWHIKIKSYLPSWMPYSVNVSLGPKTRTEYDDVMDKTLTDPTPEKEFMGMTYMDHVDALNWPDIDYKGLKCPYLVVSGAKDTFIQSTDDFVRKAKQAGVAITYLRVPDMDHYVLKRQDIVDQSFEWLKKIVHGSVQSSA